jgi:hypothetical protein
MHLGTINLEAIPSGMDEFSKMLNTMLRAKQTEAQTQSINLRNQYYPQQTQAQIEQLQLRNAYQNLINKYYPELTQARVQQMGIVGQGAGAPLNRAYAVYQQYLSKYGPNHPATKDAYNNYKVMFDQLQTRTKYQQALTQFLPTRFTSTTGKQAGEIQALFNKLRNSGITPNNNPINMATQYYMNEKPPVQPLQPMPIQGGFDLYQDEEGVF